MTTPATQAPPGAGDKLDAGVLKIAGVVVLGAIMSILDTTVVSVALPTFQTVFDASYATVAWTMTGYTLALATVIPLTGWAADRFGTKRLYMLALVLFILGSIACGLAWNIGSLITFRVLPGPRRRHADAARHDDHDQGRRPGPDRPGDGRARCPDAARPDRRPDPRWLADRGRQLALDLLHQPADRHRRVHRRLAGAGQGQPDPVGEVRLRRHAAAVAGSGAVPVRRLQHSRRGHRRLAAGAHPGRRRRAADRRLRLPRAAQGPPADRPAPVQAQAAVGLDHHDVAVRDRVLRRHAAVPDLLHHASAARPPWPPACCSHRRVSAPC